MGGETTMLPDDLPEDMPSFVARFGSDEQCREYLFEARWPDGFRCSACGHDDAYALKTKIVYECAACRKQHSLWAGTIFEQTKTGLAKWFLAIYLVTSSKGGIAATELQRQLGFGSYGTAWTWLHKLRKAMVRPDRQPLAGRVEADETHVGGPRPGKRGRGAAGKTLVGGAVEAGRGEARGRRLGPLPAAAWPGPGSPRWPTPRPRAWTPSSPPTSPSRRPRPPTAGAATSACRPRATATSPSISARPGATPRSGCPASISSSASSSAGCWAPTTARWARSTSPPTSTSTRSASIAAPPSGSATASPASSSTPCASSLPATEISSLRQHQPDGHG